MRYLYYTLYQFYTRVFQVQKYYPPIINTVGVIALLELFVIFTFVDIWIFESTGRKLINYSPLIPTAVFMGLFWLNYQYFKGREEAILKDVDLCPNPAKLSMYFLTLVLVVLLVWGYLFDGFYNTFFS